MSKNRDLADLVSAGNLFADGNIDVSELTGTLSVAGGGTGATTAEAARQNLDLEIGVDVQAYDADTAKYDDTTANFTGTLQNGGSNVLVDSDIGSTVQAYDATILVDADIGVSVQAYDATILVDADIGVSVQGYDADTAKYDDTTANFTGTLQNGGSNVVVDSDIGVTVQAYDADTAKLDVAQTFSAQQTFGEIKETTYTLGTSGSLALNPANGSIQTSVLTGNPTFTDSLEAGQTLVLMLENGASYTVTFPTMTWVTSGGNAAPTLTAKDTIVFWKISTTLYGAYVGSYV